jgi:hypothetical protein
MTNGNTNPAQSQAGEHQRGTPVTPSSVRIRSLLLVLGCLIGLGQQALGQSSLSEYQVKALFLFNFAKYVEWPVEAFSGPHAPITIGIVGNSPCIEPLQKAVQGKVVSDRPITILSLEKPDDSSKCQILFISTSEKKRVGEILNEARDRPILTVGEIDQFADQGGVIGFVKKDGKVRLEINLNAARKAKLEISSKLLSVADNVIGKK